MTVKNISSFGFEIIENSPFSNAIKTINKKTPSFKKNGVHYDWCPEQDSNLHILANTSP